MEIRTVAGTNAHQAPSLKRLVAHGLVENRAERHRVVGAEADHADARFGDDAARGLDDEHHENVRKQVGQDMVADDPEGAVAVDAGKRDVVAAFKA